MTRRRVVVMIDQASRDAFSQLLVVKYLRWRGVDVVIANQATLVPQCEWHRPHVVFASWLLRSPLTTYLNAIHRRTHVVLVDQEGGRLGEGPFKRSFDLQNGVKRETGRRCARVLAWGCAQARWLTEIGAVDSAKIVITGSPRFDPYLVPAPKAGARHLGVTLRGDLITTRPLRQMERLFDRAAPDPRDGISVGYPHWAQYEDRMWHVFASTRYMFRIVQEASRRIRAPIVVRPGPWEQPTMYDFLPKRIPTATVAPDQSQPDYIRNAFAVVDDSSSLSLEGYLVGTPTITTQALIPRLEEHIGGSDGGLFNSPYTQAYWRPRSLDEAMDLVIRAEQGMLAPAAVPELLDTYLRECHSWPRTRPSSFQMADAILELLDVPLGSRADDERSNTDDGAATLKHRVYRYVPGAASMRAAMFYAQTAAAPDRELLRRYHYFPSRYPHEAEVSRTFDALLRLTGECR